MATFKITALRANGALAYLHYDNHTSALRWASTGLDVVPATPATTTPATPVSAAQPGRKHGVRTLKISLGLSCNYGCTYCSQRFVPHAATAGVSDVAPFLTTLPQWFTPAAQGTGEGVRVEFWGGEPLVYWKALRPLAEGLRAMMPLAAFSMITNGSLLTPEINEWLDRMGFCVGVSHDGPGQRVRGPDPLEHPQQGPAIRQLYALLHPQGRISFNVMLNRQNQSRAAVQAWFTQRFGGDVQLGEGSFIDAYDKGGVALSLRAHEHVPYRVQAFNEVRHGAVVQFGQVGQKLRDFTQSITTARPAAAVGQKCGMDEPHNLALTLKGEVLTCQNVSPVSTAPNGRSHRIGHVDALEQVALDTSTHWAGRTECAGCPVLQICKGSCMFLEGALWETSCANAYSDAVPFFAGGIERLAGVVPMHVERVEGPRMPEDRAWLFGPPR